MRKSLFGIIAFALITPLWAAGHGAGGFGHGAAVSQAAMTARQNGQPVGQSVRAVARANSQGPAHANANAISHVQNSPGRANSNSVLGNGSTTMTTSSDMKGTAGTSTTTRTQHFTKAAKSKSKARKH
jgi:hypothetical protein